jgi:hypothetical protein
MFRVSIKYEMFDLQVILLMCWMNHLNCKTTNAEGNPSSPGDDQYCWRSA